MRKKEAYFPNAYISNPTYLLVLLFLFDFIFVKDLVFTTKIL
jgi:hypothetical protein